MSGRAGHSVSLALWFPRRMGTNLEAASGFAWTPGPLAWSACGSEGLFTFQSRPERKGPEKGVPWMAGTLTKPLTSVWLLLS